MTRTEVNIAAVAGVAKNDRRTASRMIAESLDIHKSVVLRILKEDLEKRKFTDRLLTCRVFRKVHPTLGSEFLTAYHEVLQILRMKRHNLK